jgi:hypothetical protein
MKNRIIIFLSLLLFTSQIGCKAQICTKDDTLFIDNKKCGRLLYNKNGEKQEKALTKNVQCSDTLFLSEKETQIIAKNFFYKYNKYKYKKGENWVPILRRDFDNHNLIYTDVINKKSLVQSYRFFVNSKDMWMGFANIHPNSDNHPVYALFISPGFYQFLSEMIKVKEFYKNKTYAEPTDVIKRYAKKKILIEYSDSLGKTLSCTISGKQIAFGNKKVKDAEVLKFCLTRLDDMFYNGNDMAQFYHIEDKIKPEGKLSITVEHKDSTEILIKDKVVDVDRVMYNEKLYELIDYISNLSEKLK